ncbi:MAG: M1 family metallopeptidase [Mycobacteriales bacterium]
MSADTFRGAGRVAAAAATVLVLSLLGGFPASAAPAASPGAPGLGDRLFPTLGNGGYDVEHYDLAFTWSASARTFRATTEVTAVATQALSRFDLDFAGNTVRRVTVQARPARFVRDGEELVITPATAIPRGRRFRVAVTYTGRPTPYQGADPGGTKGFFPTPDGFFVAPQPQAAHSVFPGNDHPSDKATITYRLTVPTGLTAAANGVLAGVRTHRSTTTWVWQEREPIATELVTLAIGRYTLYRHAGPDGLPLRDVVPTSDLAALRPFLDQTAGHLAWLRQRLGRYPFGTYGLLVVPATPEQAGFTEETQTLVVLPEWIVTSGFPAPLVASAEVHELAHQWFGDSVSPRRWSDVWLNEGPATYYAALYAAAHGGPSMADQARKWYAGSDDPDPTDNPLSDQQLRDLYGPPGAPAAAATLYSPSVYSGGALALYALHQRVGERTFEAIMRGWLSAHHDGTGDTGGFIRTADTIAGQDLRGLLEDWLYSTTTPPLPR